VSATLLLHGLPISGSKDGMVCMWDVSAPNTPLVVLEAGGPVHSMQLMEERRKHTCILTVNMHTWGGLDAFVLPCCEELGKVTIMCHRCTRLYPGW
jgi:hypothetical protein